MVLSLKRFPMRLNFSEIPLTCGLMPVPWYIVSEEGRLLIYNFSMESTNSCGYPLRIMSSLLKLFVEILLIVTYGLGSTDQTVNNSPFHVMWEVRFEVHIFVASLGFRVIRNRSKEGRVSYFQPLLWIFERAEKLLQSYWSMWTNHGSVVDVSK
jgi:hypothetical protein